jgi:hypothetical protein
LARSFEQVSADVGDQGSGKVGDGCERCKDCE